jgi:hypothetical protein
MKSYVARAGGVFRPSGMCYSGVDLEVISMASMAPEYGTRRTDLALEDFKVLTCQERKA